MTNEIKYCKFCNKEKPIQDFCKSGFAVKNICKECSNNQRKQRYKDSKKTRELQQRIDKAVEYIDSICLEEDGYVGYGDDLTPKELINILRGDE